MVILGGQIAQATPIQTLVKMEACQAVVREQEKVAAKLEALSSCSRERLSDAISKLEVLKSVLNEGKCMSLKCMACIVT